MAKYDPGLIRADAQKQTVILSGKSPLLVTRRQDVLASIRPERHAKQSHHPASQRGWEWYGKKVVSPLFSHGAVLGRSPVPDLPGWGGDRCEPPRALHRSRRPQAEIHELKGQHIQQHFRQAFGNLKRFVAGPDRRKRGESDDLPNRATTWDSSVKTCITGRFLSRRRRCLGWAAPDVLAVIPQVERRTRFDVGLRR